MTSKEFKKLKEEILKREGNVRFTDKLLENLTEKQIKNLLNFYLSNIKLDSELKNRNVDFLEDAIASSIVEEEEQENKEPKKVALEKKPSKKENKKEVKKEGKKDKKEDAKNEVVIDINTLKLHDKLLIIDERDNFSIVDIRDIEPAYGILGRDINDLANCFSISKTELEQGFYIYNKKQYFVKPYRG